jgi:hypothetical protein
VVVFIGYLGMNIVLNINTKKSSLSGREAKKMDRFDLLLYGTIIFLVVVGAFAVYFIETDRVQNGVQCNVSDDCDDYCISFCENQSDDILKEFQVRCEGTLIGGNYCIGCLCSYWNGWKPVKGGDV